MKGCFSWYSYSKKIESMILNPHNAGWFTPEDALSRKMHFATGKGGSREKGNELSLYWFVDPVDGTIVDCKYQLFGETLLIAVAEATAGFLVGKNYDQARRLTPELLEKRLWDKKNQEFVIEGLLPYMNLVIEAIEEAATCCEAIPLLQSYNTPLVEQREGIAYPEWMELTKEKKLQVIEELFTEEIRPYIELDQGGVKILDLVNDRELHIAYEGACVTCYSSVGTTLSSIQGILQERVHPTLQVVPQFPENIAE
jgi:NifU-like protein